MTEKTAAQDLLEWYDKNGRVLPWRVKGGACSDPYVVLVSEFMLQQTTVKTVIPYFKRFMECFPTVQILAEATEDEVLQYWQGLGYYSRARSLHKTAKIIAYDYKGEFPRDKTQVLKLKGIGNYTVASFLALAFNLPETVVDGNVIRIICRLYHLTSEVNQIRELILQKAITLNQTERSADYASAIMDLGALICTPKKPQCLLCPWQDFCQSKNKADLEKIPYIVKVTKKEQTAKVYIIHNDKGEVFIRKHAEKGLLFGLYEFPWGAGFDFVDAKDMKLEVTHVFTHIKLKLQLFQMHAKCDFMNGFWVEIEKLSEYPMSTLMKKVWQKYVNFNHKEDN